MSLLTWKKEFYKTPANRIKTVRGALEHSILKWTGLRLDNLRRHGVRQLPKGHVLVDEGSREFSINCVTCALCQLYYDYDLVGGDRCKECPFHDNLRNCTAPYFTYTGVCKISIFNTWVQQRNPEPMISALQFLLELKKADMLIGDF